LLALVGMVIAAPLIVVCAAAVRLFDGCPAFIQLTRGGVGGEQFGMWKIRSMSTGQRTPRSDGPPVTLGSDPRITRVGEYLRRYRLDELPQLVNVLRGEMSLIGPRPEALEFIGRQEPRWQKVLEARPGIAGVTQVLVHDWEQSFAGNALDASTLYAQRILPLKLGIDAWYVERASPVVDALVVLALAERFFCGRRWTALHRYAGRHIPEADPLLQAAAGTSASLADPS
jgi:lipopolysaccharide/colanic/teichoic acid biosynthesis glycosyltransferase